MKFIPINQVITLKIWAQTQGNEVGSLKYLLLSQKVNKIANANIMLPLEETYSQIAMKLNMQLKLGRSLSNVNWKSSGKD